MKFVLMILMTTVIAYGLPFKMILMYNHNTQLSATTVALLWDGNRFEWKPSCFDMGIYKPTFSALGQSETITITVNEGCDGTLEEFCERWLSPSANFKHYALWLIRYKDK